jgi:hypothetical protein
MRKETTLARFNLDDYETVEQRHARVLALFPDLRCVIVNHTTPEDRANKTWVVEARVYLNAGDQAVDLPKATEWAFEVDGQGMANATSALENACTSALGRSLRWAVGGSKGPSRQEMEKVARGAQKDWLAEATKLKEVKALRMLWAEAKQAGADRDTLKALEALAGELGSVGGEQP